jgi:DNA-binding response OmpR family regulator
LKIPVIEDEPKAAEYLRQGLAESGYAVEVALNGTDGLHAVANGDHDLLILDVMLPGRHRATREGQRIDLTAKEFALLTLLVQKAGEVLSRTQIASLIWDIHFDSDSNVVEVAMRRLRAKIDDPCTEQLIHTVRGVGYVLERRSQ